MASCSKDRTIIIWNLNDFSINFILLGHLRAVLSLEVLTHSNYLASSSCDKTIIIWNESFKQIKTLRGHTDCVNVLNYYKKQYLLSGSNDRTLRIWNAQTFQIFKVLSGNQDSILSLTSLNSYFAYGTKDNQIKLYGDFYTNKNTISNYFFVFPLQINILGQFQINSGIPAILRPK